MCHGRHPLRLGLGVEPGGRKLLRGTARFRCNGAVLGGTPSFDTLRRMFQGSCPSPANFHRSSHRSNIPYMACRSTNHTDSLIFRFLHHLQKSWLCGYSSFDPLSHPPLPYVITKAARMDHSSTALLSPPRPPIAGRRRPRSPQPYYRKRPPPPCPAPESLAVCSANSAMSTYLPSPSLTPDTSRPPSPFPRKRSAGGSESGTEADDELARKLPAPPGKRRRTASEDEVYYGEEELFEGEEERSRERRGTGSRRRRRGIVFVRRGIEIALMGMLVGIVLASRDGRIWKEVMLRNQGEFVCFLSGLRVDLTPKNPRYGLLCLFQLCLCTPFGFYFVGLL